MGEIEGGALLEEDAELRVEVLVGLGAILGLFLEELEEPLRDDLVQLLDQSAILHRLARDVQRQVLAVDDPLEEAEPLGQQVLRLGVDQDLAAVEGNAGFRAGEAELLGVFLRDEEQRVDRERGVGREMQAQPRFIEGVGLELVELRVFLLGDLGLVAQPHCLDGVDALAIERDRERDESAVALEDFLHLPLLAVVAAVVLQLDDDADAATLVRGLLDRVATAAVAGPDVARLGAAPGAGVDLDRLGDHERGVEADAELPDEIGVLLAGFGQ